MASSRRETILFRGLLACGLVHLGALIAAIRSGAFADPASGFDFIGFRVAGLGLIRAARLYDWASFAPLFAALAPHPKHGMLPFLYPPTALLLFRPLGQLPLAVAHLALALGSLALLAVVLGRICGPIAVAALFAWPALLPEIGEGQTGFLTAALLGAGLLLDERRPMIAGVCAGLLAIKPHLDLMLPLMLLATCNRRALAAFLATLAAAVAASAVAFGSDAWPAFLRAAAIHSAALGRGELIGWGALQSLYGLLRAAGVASLPASACQQLLALLSAAATVAACRSRKMPADKRRAVVAIATVAASPYLLVWDLPLLGIGLAFLWRDPAVRSLPWAGPILLAAAFLPAITVDFHLPSGQAAGLLAIVSIFPRQAERGAPPRTPLRPGGPRPASV